MTETAVVTVDPVEQRKRELTVQLEALVAENVRSVDSLDGGKLQRWSVRLPLQSLHQYLIPGRGIKPEDLPADLRGTRAHNWQGEETNKLAWGRDYTAAVRAEGYFWMNKVGVVSFHTPETVHDRDGREVPNPIHSRDYLYHREIGMGYSETGQQVLYVEDIELDFNAAWEAERLRKLGFLIKPAKGRSKPRGAEEPTGWDDEDEAASAYEASQAPATQAPVPPVSAAGDYLMRDDYGRPKQGPHGELLFRLPDKDEVEAMDRLLSLRNYGGRMAKTIAQRRILMSATATRTLWNRVSIHRPELYTVYVMVVGWRDQMSPDERLAKAQEEARQVFGAPIKTRGEAAVPTTQELSETEAVEGTFTEEQLDAPEGHVPEVNTGSGVAGIPSEPVTETVRAGVIPGVTVGMPGESLALAVCGEHMPMPTADDPGKTGQYPCTRKPGHKPMPHESKDGVWPAT